MELSLPGGGVPVSSYTINFTVSGMVGMIQFSLNPWPSYSPDITPTDILLWGYLKYIMSDSGYQQPKDRSLTLPPLKKPQQTAANCLSLFHMSKISHSEVY